MASLKQQHYRKLMREQKAKTGSKPKVDHPLARYNALGQLSCIVCGLQVKSELLWTTHLHSKKHKENLVALKGQRSGSGGQQPAPESIEFVKPSVPVATKRKNREQQDSENTPSAKKLKKENSTEKGEVGAISNLPADFFDSRERPPLVGGGGAGSGSEEEEEEEEEGSGGGSGAVEAVPAGLPPGSFDKTEKTTGQEDKEQKPETQEKKSQDPKEALPEGFFDDPKMDAKARKVEYKDPIMEEWEKFKKSIQKEDDISDALLVEGDEEAKEERELIEVNEQVECFTRAEKLRQKQEELMLKRAQPTSQSMDTASQETKQGNSGSSDDEMDFDEFLDWRAKIS